MENQEKLEIGKARQGGHVVVSQALLHGVALAFPLPGARGALMLARSVCAVGLDLCLYHPLASTSEHSTACKTSCHGPPHELIFSTSRSSPEVAEVVEVVFMLKTLVYWEQICHNVVW